MAPLYITKLLFLLVLFALLLVPPSSSLRPRDLLEKKKNHEEDSHGEDGVQVLKNKSGTTLNPIGTTNQIKNKTKLVIKPTTSAAAAAANSTKSSTKSQPKPILNKKLNSTSKLSNSTKPISKPTNSTKPISKTTNSTKPISKTTKPTSLLTQKSTDPTVKKKAPTPEKKSAKPVGRLSYREEEDEDDFVSELRDLPSRFQETLIPDLEVLSTTSKAYLNKANKQISKGFNPIVGKKYAPLAASVISFAFILIPFLLVSLIFNRIKAYFSLQKLIIFIQIYLSIYFSILSLSSLVTGLEPLKFFYATSQSTYICIQLLQTLAYVLYLVVLLMYLVLVFSTTTESSIVSKLLGVGQTFVGLAVGLHYYMTVFHRAVLHQPPKTSWKVHAFYAACFLVICVLGTAERRKKAYVVDGTQVAKKS